MKIRIPRVDPAVILPDDTATFPVKDSLGRTHTLELAPQAQKDLINALLASPPIQSGTKPPRVLQIGAVVLSTTNQARVGLALYMRPEMAVYAVMERVTFETLKSQVNGLSIPKQSNH